ncbi:hypothetical protein CTEN210_09861 [Chaetoceros tenuissimus]|uniref:RING-type E3 ubiquitin transferase n=1 Tax=Chaetoceros tenuissimus TaxID=426638 RepID=A0AAD3CYL7_9STRA|nr:hypothetical protein CTEN210_09861 [Chaetoceros tenuissimus]
MLVHTKERQLFRPGVRMHKGLKTLFYNGEKLCISSGIDGKEPIYKIHDIKERETWEQVFVLPGVKIIPYRTFYCCRNIKRVIMSDSVKRIANRAFWLCENIVFLNLSRNLKVIEELAFAGCTSLHCIFIPLSCTYIDDNAFYGCTKLLIFNAPKHVQLENGVILKTALMEHSPFQTCTIDERFNFHEVNEWIKYRHDKLSLHKICCSEQPILEQEYSQQDWMTKDECGLTPMHYLAANQNADTNTILSIITAHEAIFIGPDETKFENSLLFDIATSSFISFHVLHCFMKTYPMLGELRDKNGIKLNERYAQIAMDLASIEKNDAEELFSEQRCTGDASSLTIAKRKRTREYSFDGEIISTMSPSLHHQYSIFDMLHPEYLSLLKVKDNLVQSAKKANREFNIFKKRTLIRLGKKNKEIETMKAILSRNGEEIKDLKEDYEKEIRLKDDVIEMQTEKEEILSEENKCLKQHVRGIGVAKGMNALSRKLKTELECPICLDELDDPHLIPECGHRFCCSCIKDAIQKSGHECPLCRSRITSKRGLRKDKLIGKITRLVFATREQLNI